MLLLGLGLRLAGLLYYTQLGASGDLIIVSILLAWKTGYPRLASIVVKRGWTLGLFVVFATTCYLFLPAWDYGRKAKSPTLSGPGRPLLFPCRIMNAPILPTKRSFEYSSLLIGVPVGWNGVAGGLVSVDCEVPGFKTWYTIDAVDHLIPGPTHLRLRDKLDWFLTSRGIEASRYPHAYLVTTTRSIGGGRKQLSFWYLYSAEKQLTAMIIEVNNAFGKRLAHVLYRDDKVIDNVDRDSSVTSSRSVPHRTIRQKDVHGSLFIFRNGTCSLVASDPLSPNMKDMGPIDNTVDFKASQVRAKPLTRIISTREAIDPLQLSLKQRISFVFRWRWSSIAAFPWTAKEAAIPLIKRRLDMREFPKLLKGSITRDTTEVERGLELVFRNYLRYLVKQSSSSLSVRYVPAGALDAIDEEMLSTAAGGKPDSANHLEFKVLTPTFYLRFVHYAHDFEAIFCEFNENRTIWLSEPTLLPQLVFKRPSPPLSTASYLDYAYFTAIKKLRKLPKKAQHPLAPRQIATTRSLGDIREFRLSSMDGYVLAHEEDKIRYLYRRLVLKLFIADRIARGSIGILSLVALLLRILVGWIIVWT
ncbi:hypothetical protein F4803DRAFT_58463 [Xylaria telfairii]|nr:hypothetical protein F4803DRAFT_58463 [Xylaria telfairii]